MTPEPITDDRPTEPAPPSYPATPPPAAVSAAAVRLIEADLAFRRGSDAWDANLAHGKLEGIARELEFYGHLMPARTRLMAEKEYLLATLRRVHLTMVLIFALSEFGEAVSSLAMAVEAAMTRVQLRALQALPDRDLERVLGEVRQELGPIDETVWLEELAELGLLREKAPPPEGVPLPLDARVAQARESVLTWETAVKKHAGAHARALQLLAQRRAELADLEAELGAVPAAPPPPADACPQCRGAGVVQLLKQRLHVRCPSCSVTGEADSTIACPQAPQEVA